MLCWRSYSHFYFFWSAQAYSLYFQKCLHLYYFFICLIHQLKSLTIVIYVSISVSLIYIWDCFMKCLYVNGCIILYLLICHSLLILIPFFIWILFCHILKLLPQVSFKFLFLSGISFSILLFLTFLCLSVLFCFSRNYHLFLLFVSFPLCDMFESASRYLERA